LDLGGCADDVYATADSILFYCPAGLLLSYSAYSSGERVFYVFEEKANLSRLGELIRVRYDISDGWNTIVLLWNDIESWAESK
jgi:hypothetical protein